MNELEDKYILENTKMIPQGGGEYVSLQYQIPGFDQPTTSNSVARSDLKAEVLTSWCNSIRDIVKDRAKAEQQKRDAAKKARKAGEYEAVLDIWMSYPKEVRDTGAVFDEAQAAARALAELTDKSHPLVDRFNSLAQVGVEQGQASPGGEAPVIQAVSRQEMDDFKSDVMSGFDEIKKMIMENK